MRSGRRASETLFHEGGHAAHFANVDTPGFVQLGTSASGTWLSQGTWGRRKPAAIDGDAVVGTPGDTAVLVAVDDPEIAAQARADGFDIVFTAGDGVTRLDHFLESWNSGTTELRAWVLVPGLTAGADTELFVYYGNATALDQQDPIAVFGPDADLVIPSG